MRYQSNNNTKKPEPENGGKYNPSMTVPDMALSIQQLLERQTRGIDILGTKVPVYDEEDPDDSFYVIPNFDKMDLSEKQALAEAAAAEVARLKSLLEQEKIREDQQRVEREREEQRKEWLQNFQEKPIKQPQKADKGSQGENPQSTNIS